MLTSGDLVRFEVYGLNQTATVFDDEFQTTGYVTNDLIGMVIKQMSSTVCKVAINKGGSIFVGNVIVDRCHVL